MQEQSEPIEFVKTGKPVPAAMNEVFTPEYLLEFFPATGDTDDDR